MPTQEFVSSSPETQRRIEGMLEKGAAVQRAAVEGAQKGFQAVEERVEDVMEQGEECVNRHQLGAILTALAGGIVLGFIFGRPRRRPSLGESLRGEIDHSREALVGLALAGLAMGTGALRSTMKDARKLVERELKPVRRAAKQAAERMHLS